MAVGMLLWTLDMKMVPFLEGRYKRLIKSVPHTLHYGQLLFFSLREIALFLAVSPARDLAITGCCFDIRVTHVYCVCCRRDYLKALHMDPLCLSARVNLGYNLQVRSLIRLVPL